MDAGCLRGRSRSRNRIAATVSKGAMFALLLRYFYRSGTATNHQILLVFSSIAIAPMLAGNVLALLQANVKRILAYSSIAHMGYLLVALLASRQLVVEAITFDLIAYFITTLAGIPLTAGFIGKFYIVAAGASSEIWALIIILVVSSVIGLFYYLRIVAAMYASEDHEISAIGPRISNAAGAVLGVLTGLLA